jgi:Flp pilus assembly pilin Flp
MSCLLRIFGQLGLGVAGIPGQWSRQQGQALIEYALIVSLIALVAIVGLRQTGANVSGLLNKIAGEV